MTVLSTIDLKILLQFVCIDHINIRLFCQNENNPFSPYLSTIIWRQPHSCRHFVCSFSTGGGLCVLGTKSRSLTQTFEPQNSDEDEPVPYADEDELEPYTDEDEPVPYADEDQLVPYPNVLKLCRVFKKKILLPQIVTKKWEHFVLPFPK